MTQSDSRSLKGAYSISAKIRRAIQSGTYLHGEQLPAERDLSHTYASSRSTIRKALENLEEIGLVVRKVGAGTFVNYSGPTEIEVENVVELISPIQLIDTRVGFERQMLRLAIVHATVRDIENIQHGLEVLEGLTNDKVSFTEQDSNFHMLIAKATRNPLIIQLYGQINEVRTHDQWRTARELVLTPEKINHYNQHHRDMYDAIRNRDTAAGIDAVNAHMDMAREDLLATHIED